MAITYLGSGASQAANQTVTITLGQGVSVGQGLIYAITINSNASPGVPTDSAGNTWTQLDTFHNSSGVLQMTMCYAPVTNALIAGNTVSHSVGGGLRIAAYLYCIDNWAGADSTSSTTGEGRSDSGTAVSNNLQAFVTSNPTDDLFGFVVCSQNTTLTGVTAGWNAAPTPSVITDDNAQKLFAFSQEVASASTYAFSGTLGAASVFASMAGAFKYSAGGVIIPTPTIVVPEAAVQRAANW
jgi:hypothetical protein